jgi:lysophospholipase L1-like esterase
VQKFWFLVVLSFLCTGMCGVLAGCSGAGSGSSTVTNPPASTSIWAAAWADAPDSAAGGAGSERTFREIVKPTVGSRGTVRLHFSNFFGTSAVTLGAVRVGVQSSGAAVASGDAAVTFNGLSSVTIPAGGFATSDNVPFNFNYGVVLAVTEYVSGSWTALTQHEQAGGAVTSYATATGAGNMTTDAAGASFTQTTLDTFLLDRVDVYGSYAGTVAAFGSSTTDGFYSGLDAHMTYPDQLAAMLHAAGRDDVGIANEGIGGDTVLGTTATAGELRFPRDVLALPGLYVVLSYLGANDLRDSCQTAVALIPGEQNLAAQAKSAGVKYFLGITAPSTFCGKQNPGGFGTRFTQWSGEEADREAFIAWEKSTAASTVSGVQESAPVVNGLLDFNNVLVDSANLSYMLPALDSGDDIHPNATGYGKMAAAVPLTIF